MLKSVPTTLEANEKKQILKSAKGHLNGLNFYKRSVTLSLRRWSSTEVCMAPNFIIFFIQFHRAFCDIVLPGVFF